MAGVLLRHVEKQYSGNDCAVEDMNLDIADGEFVVLVGPSGCGKSTTLRMIAGLEATSTGEIYIGDRLVNDVPPGQRDVAMVFQNYALYPHMSVYQNLAFGLKMRRTAPGEIDRRVHRVAQSLSLNRLLDRRPRELSGGERQRVALGRAIVREPQVFLFDEPLSNLDAQLRVQMRAEIARLHQQLKSTVIYVTHDQIEAMTLGQRVVLMKQGVVQQVDTPMNLYHHPANRFVGSFIGSPAMNFFRGEVNGREFRLATGCAISLDRSRDRSPVPPGPATLGVRPEDLVVNGNGLPLATVALEVVEPMGHETMVHFELDGQRHVARLGADIAAQPGLQLPLSIRPDAFHLFANDEEARRLN